MATYKVIQDIEAEDKLLGPLTLRQFLYAVIVAVMGFIAFRLAITGWYLALPFLPPMVLFAVLAAPFGHDQSSEVWLLAKIRFALKPHRRIWDQSGMKHLVTVTAPKKIEAIHSDGLSQTEVKSRLHALADTIDTRGWAVKSGATNPYAQPSFATAGTGSDRLIDPSSLPREVPNYQDVNTLDMMDSANNPAAQHLDQMMAASTNSHRQQVVASMQQPGATAAPTQNDYWFMNQPDSAQLPAPGYSAFGAQTVTPHAPPSTPVASKPESSAEQKLLDRLHQQGAANDVPVYGHMKVIDPIGAHQTQTSTNPPPQNIAPPAVTVPPEPAILELANNDDLSVATIAREAERTRSKKTATNEVVVSLR